MNESFSPRLTMAKVCWSRVIIRIGEAVRQSRRESRRFLQRIEKGAANPGIDVLSRIRKGLKCSWNELADGI
jgi:transcriptional regulator with XRE-family HTH domain